jgi:SAM-dependent methyltransferase
MEKEEYRRLFEHEGDLWWFTGMREISSTLLNRFLPGSRTLSVLDAGCGTGGMLQTLAEMGSTVGMDLSADAIEFARRRNADRLLQASISSLPFREATFDLVTSFDVIYHRAVPNDEEALAEAARVLRPGGTLLIRVPAYDRFRSHHDEAVHTRQRYGREELERKLRRAGLVPIYTTYAVCFLFPLAVMKRLSEKLSSKTEMGSEVQAVSRPLNGLLHHVLRLEAVILRHARLPFGLSLFAVGRRV